LTKKRAKKGNQRQKRICAKCQQQILRNHKWRTVIYIGANDPVATVHRDCANPTLEPIPPISTAMIGALEEARPVVVGEHTFHRDFQ
jgi:hypothetical protein